MRAFGGVLAVAVVAACGSSKDADEGRAARRAPQPAAKASDVGAPDEPLRIAVGHCYDADAPLSGGTAPGDVIGHGAIGDVGGGTAWKGGQSGGGMIAPTTRGRRRPPVRPGTGRVILRTVSIADGPMERAVAYRYLRRRVGHVQRCYQRRAPGVSGTVSVVMHVSGAGNVEKVVVGEAPSAARSCFEGPIRAMRFPETPGRVAWTARVIYRLDGEDGGAADRPGLPPRQPPATPEPPPKPATPPAPEPHPYAAVAEVTGALAAKADEVRACFAVARAAETSLHGTVVIRMTVDGQGLLSGVHVTGEDKGAADCLGRLASGLTVPAAPGEPRAVACGVAYGRIDEASARAGAPVIEVTAETIRLGNATTDDLPAALNETYGEHVPGDTRPRFVVLRAEPDVSFARVHGVLGDAGGYLHVVYDARHGEAWEPVFVPEVPDPDRALYAIPSTRGAVATLVRGESGALEATAISPAEGDVYAPLELRVAPDVRWGDVVDRVRAARKAGYPDVRWTLATAD